MTLELVKGWTLFLVLGGFGVFASVCMWMPLISLLWEKHRRGVSFVPFLLGAISFLGFMSCPVEAFRWWALAALLLDPWYSLAMPGILMGCIWHGVGWLVRKSPSWSTARLVPKDGSGPPPK